LEGQDIEGTDGVTPVAIFRGYPVRSGFLWSRFLLVFLPLRTNPRIIYEKCDGL
jgi:hypothetical protein